MKRGKCKGKPYEADYIADLMSVVKNFYASLKGDGTLSMIEEKNVEEIPFPPVEEVKRGRKPKSAGEKPVQVSVYLKPELYEAVRDLISNRESISETVSRLLGWYVKKNEAVLEQRRLKIKELEAIQPSDLN